MLNAKLQAVENPLKFTKDTKISKNTFLFKCLRAFWLRDYSAEANGGGATKTAIS